MSRHKVFISYHHADRSAVEDFIRLYDDKAHVFITLGIGNNFIPSTDATYIMNEIRRRFLADSTVTIVFIGQHTWSRRYVDWEIQASLQDGSDGLPNGLLGIRLSPGCKIPERFAYNYAAGAQEDCYARLYDQPNSVDQLKSWIDDAHKARRSRRQLIVNPDYTFKYNRSVSILGRISVVSEDMLTDK